MRKTTQSSKKDWWLIGLVLLVTVSLFAFGIFLVLNEVYPNGINGWTVLGIATASAILALWFILKRMKKV